MLVKRIIFIKNVPMSPNYRRRGPYLIVLERLKAKPMFWAKVSTRNKTSNSTSFNKTYLRMGYEFTARRKGKLWDLYARYNPKRDKNGR